MKFENSLLNLFINISNLVFVFVVFESICYICVCVCVQAYLCLRHGMLECGGLIPFKNLFSPSTVSSRDKSQLHGKCFHLLAYLCSSIILWLLLILIIFFFGLLLFRNTVVLCILILQCETCIPALMLYDLICLPWILFSGVVGRVFTVCSLQSYNLCLGQNRCNTSVM